MFHRYALPLPPRRSQHNSRQTDRSPTRSQQRNNNAQILSRVQKQIRKKMDLVFDNYLLPDSDFPVCDSAVWIFGRSYSIHYDLDELRRCVSSCLWMTYRKNFPNIGDTTLTSDRGWGCMIRAGQMLLGKALLLRHLGHDWHWTSETREPVYMQILSLFADVRAAPFSLHQIAQSGATLGKSVGSWLGPNTVAQAFKKLLSSESTSVDLHIHIAMDSTVVTSEVKRECLALTGGTFHASGTAPSSYAVNTPRPDPKWKPLLLVIPLRLGLSDLNPSYVPGIKAALEMRQNIGIIGGRPNHALYFIGYAEDEVLFLDPHTVQSAVTIGTKAEPTDVAADETYHIQKPGRMPFAAMDPSIAACFLCRCEADFDALCSKLIDRFKIIPLPLFEICERRPSDWSSLPSTTSTTMTSPGKSGATASLSFTSIGHGFLTTGSSTQKCNSHSSNSSPGSYGRNKSDIEDEEFEILG